MMKSLPRIILMLLGLCIFSALTATADHQISQKDTLTPDQTKQERVARDVRQNQQTSGGRTDKFNNSESSLDLGSLACPPEMDCRELAKSVK
jgi:septal ring-binding cell division protein DamX